MAHKGIFKPKNPQKYVGDASNIVYRSSLERRFMRWCDEKTYVISWCSEEIIIPYYDPVSKKRRRYFPDFLIRVKDKKEFERTILIEVKPTSQSSAPRPLPEGAHYKQRQRLIRDVMTWKVNEAKWTAAKAYCQERGWEWCVMNEKDIPVY